MSHLLSLFVVLTIAGPAVADPPSVAELVKQLGDPKYAKREAAHRELVRRGEGIVPELDRLANTADAETAERLRKIRYELVGYLDDILRLLAEVPEGKDSAPVPVSAELRGLIASHQPRAGNLLLSVLAHPGHELYRRVLRTFISTWDAATPGQIETYLRQAVSLKTTHRRKFPAKVGAMISFEAQLRDGWTGWPPLDGDKQFDIRTRTTRYLDGKPYDKPFEYKYPFATVGWYRVGELAEGKHTIHAELEYEFTHRGEKRTGKIHSKNSHFVVISEGTPDDLVAPESTDAANLVRAAFRVGDPFGFSMTVSPVELPEPQVRWETTPGQWAGLVCPTWTISTALKFDLCYEVEIREVKGGKVYTADPICVLAGSKEQGYVIPRDVLAFAGDRDGLVPVEVTLRPSRAVALSNPNVTRYYPEPVTTRLRIQVLPTIPQASQRK